jgi:hypothetical protein
MQGYGFSGGRRWPVILLLFVALSAAFQGSGLSPDGLLSDTAELKSHPLWAADHPEAVKPYFRVPDHDYVRYFAPYAAFLQRELRAGHLPLWNPYILTGVPVAETLQPGLFHPTVLVITALPFEHALTVLAVVRLALAGFAMFLFTRVIGCSLAAAGLAAVLFMFSPFHLFFRFHPILNATPLMPLLLAVSELHLRAEGRRRWMAVWALLAAGTLIAGHVQTSVHVLAVAWIYHLLRAAAARHEVSLGRRLSAALGFLAGGTLLAALGAAVSLWGHAALILDGHALWLRSRFAGYRALPPDHLGSLILPAGFGGLAISNYLGVVTLILAAGGVAARAVATWPVAGIGLGAWLAAYGAPPVAGALAVLPVIGVADHSRLIVVAHLALAVLAARGLDGLRTSVRSRRAMLVATLALVVALALLWGTGLTAGPRRWLGAEAALHRSVVFAALGGAVLVAARSVRPAWTTWLVVALALVDLWVAHGDRPRHVPAALPALPMAMAPVVNAPGVGRTLVPGRLMPPNVNMLYGIEGLGGFEPATTQRTWELLVRAGFDAHLDLFLLPPAAPKVNDLRLLDALNVTFVVSERPIDDPRLHPHLDELARAPVAIYRNRNALPRAFVVDAAHVAAGRAEALALLADPAVDIRRVVVLEGPLPSDLPATSSAEGSEPRPAEIRDYRPGHVRLAAASPRGGYLVFSETFATGWRAAVDGRPAPVLRADYALVGVPLPPGEHEVVLRYRPWPVLAGGAISLVTLLALAAVALGDRRPYCT